MKQVSVTKPTRWAVGLTCGLLGGVCLTEGQAQAGQWYMGIKAHLINTEEGGEFDYDSRDDDPEGSTRTDDGPDGGGWVSFMYGTSAGPNHWAKREVQSWVELSWAPDGGDWKADPMPKKVTVLHANSGRVKFSWDPAQNGGNTRLPGHTLEIDGGEMVDEGVQWFNGTASQTFSSSKSKLFTVNTGGSNPVKFPMQTLSAKGDIEGDSGSGNSAMVDAGSSARLDSRSVSISRGVAGKNEDDPTLDKDKDEWVGKNGTGHGHTTYSYNDIRLPNSTPNIQQFSAALGGTWTWKTDPNGTGDIPDVDWSWSPAGNATPGDTYASSSQVMDLGKLIESDEGLVPGVKDKDNKTITYTATDNGDGASGTADYELTVHDPWEAELATDDGRQLWKQYYPSNILTSNPIYPGQPDPEPYPAKYAYSEEATATQEESYKESKGTSLSIDAGVTASKSVLAPYLEAAGVDLSIKGEANIAVTTEQNATQLNSTGFSYSVTPPLMLPAGKFSKPLINVWGRRKVYRLRHWSPSGFAGDSYVVAYTFEAFEPRWENPQFLPSGQGGPSGDRP